MIFFNSAEPLFRIKQRALDIQDLKGLFHIHWRIGSRTLIAAHYTRIDQIFMIWAVVAALIFMTAQFSPLSWATQAPLWTALTLGASCLMGVWSWYWTGVERLRWLLWLWAAVLLTGVGLTDFSIYTHWGIIMGHLCPLWLLLCAIGYALTGIGLQSRSLLLMASIHLGGIPLLSLTGSMQFLVTGLVMASTLAVLGEYQWDMRLPIAFANLTPEEQHFNQQQHQGRQRERLLVKSGHCSGC
jgi:hypothetical protein